MCRFCGAWIDGRDGIGVDDVCNTCWSCRRRSMGRGWERRCLFESHGHFLMRWLCFPNLMSYDSVEIDSPDLRRGMQ